MKNKTVTTLLCSVIFASNVAAQAKQDDPYENFNRAMFDFNGGIDGYVASPLANGYKFIAPQFLQTGVFNFFNNLKNFNIVLNDLLQAKFTQSASDLGRLTLNSTAGLGGLVDVAKHVGLEQNDEDFDQTLAVWGVPEGSYLVLPFVGPTTVRGVPASAFDTAANPATYAGIPARYISAPVQFMSVLNMRANAEGGLKFINEAAMDKYVFTRESFLQWRKSLENDGAISSSIEDDLLEDSPASNFKSRDYSKQFELASQSFSTVARRFDETTQKFEQANQKIKQLTNR